jgi:crotonobetainyl-CoA:carnitine CoA-transferase CaiB-like acyl-CoA transferase
MTMNRPFDGIRIVDLSMFMSGPLVTLIAADLGADVIKVESVQRLDGWRGSGGGGDTPPWEGSPSFNWINRDKRGVTLNLADPRGADILKRLVAISDVVVENYTPRVMENFGLGYAVLRAINPAIIMLSMPGFGMTGPWRDYTAFAWSTEQMSGISHLTGYEGGPPLFTNTTGGDPLAGLMGAVALFSALHHRRESGEGQFIDLSQLEASTWFTGDALVEASLTGRDRVRRGNRDASKAPHNTYPCLDGRWVAIACVDDDAWKRLVALALGAEWASENYANRKDRAAVEDDIDRAISAWTAGLPANEVAAQCQAVGVAAGAVLNGQDLAENEHLKAREYFLEYGRRWIGTRRHPGQPFRLSAALPVEVRPAPTLGEHTAEVLGSLLNLTAAELEALEASDITGTIPLAAR